MQINEEMLEGLNKILNPITRSAVVEDVHLHRSSSSLKGQFQGLRDRAYLLDSMRFLQDFEKAIGGTGLRVLPETYPKYAITTWLSGKEGAGILERKLVNYNKSTFEDSVSHFNDSYPHPLFYASF